MLLNRIYDEKDLSRYRSEKEKATKDWQEKLRTAGVPEDLLESFARQTVDRLVAPPAVVGLDVRHTGTHAEQNFSTSLVMDMLQTGVAEIRNKELVLHAQPEDLRYTIRRAPGRYCLHCDAKLSDDQDGRAAQQHVAQLHAGKESPDASNPAGYVAINHFETVLDAQQHERFKVQRAAAPAKKGGK